MIATIKLEKNHFPVLLDELISIISPLYGGTFIDCTFGQGGYSKKILEYKHNKIIAIDRDQESKNIADKFKKKFGDRFNFKLTKFSNLNEINNEDKNIKGIIFDLGVSINQINDEKKKISFNSKGKLNMGLGYNKINANDVINRLSEKDLSSIFKIFGEEKNHKLIAKKIAKERNSKNLLTEDLVRIIEKSKKKNFKTNSSTKVFQAIRIFVNNEISELINGLINGFKILPAGSVIAVVTFHSLEDKIVKYFFKNYSEDKNVSRYLPNQSVSKKIFKLLNKKPILPSATEVKRNPPSRSAKLRYAIKINEKQNFDEFRDKFKYLLDVENLSMKL